MEFPYACVGKQGQFYPGAFTPTYPKKTAQEETQG